MKNLFKFVLVCFMWVSLSGMAQPKPIKIVTEDFPPFQTLENGQITGPMYSVMKAICDEAKIKCDIQLLEWKDAYKQALNGEADVVFSILLEVPERAQFFLLSPSIVNTSYSFFVTSRNKWKYTGFKSLDNMTIGAYGPSGTSIVAQETVKNREISGYNSTKLIIEHSIVESFQQLIIGKYGSNGAVVVNRDVGLALLKKHSIVGPKPAGDIKEITYGFGVSRKSPNKDVYYKMVDALRVLQEKGTIKETLRWHGLKASPVNKGVK
jgi:polar amino acid transport system substrate-binding protein